MPDPTPRVIEPELLAATPRKTVWTRETIVWRYALWNLLAGFVVLIVFFAGRDLATWDALIERGVSVPAKVIGKHKTYRKTTSHFRDFAFVADGGKTVRDSDYVQEAEYDAVKIGDTLTVTYLPGSRGTVWQLGSVSPLTREDRLWMWSMNAGFVTVLLAVALVLVDSAARREQRLLANGVAVVGHVTKCDAVKNSNPPLHLIAYCYSVSSDDHFETRTEVTKAQYETILTSGGQFTVLYDPLNPSRNQPYFRLKAARILGA